MRETFTTDEVARMTHFHPRTVTRLFDYGKLRGYRVPGCQIRMVSREALLVFISEYGLAIPSELEETNATVTERNEDEPKEVQPDSDNPPANFTSLFAHCG